jgi:hypothetical protein
MFLKGPYLDLVEQGLKTTTIRPWKVCKLKPGSILSLNGKIRVTVTKVEQIHIDDVDDRRALADGFVSRRSFLRAFRQCYPALRPERVWVLTFTRRT